MRKRSEKETSKYLSNNEIFVPLFKELRGYLKTKLIPVKTLSGDHITYWTCGYDHTWDHEKHFFKNIKTFCRERNLDFLGTLNEIDKKVGYFYCECQIVNHCNDEII